jgi:hypothetical protein
MEVQLTSYLEMAIPNKTNSKMTKGKIRNDNLTINKKMAILIINVNCRINISNCHPIISFTIEISNITSYLKLLYILILNNGTTSTNHNLNDSPPFLGMYRNDQT